MTNSDPTHAAAEQLLEARRVFDIDAYGWWDENEVDQEFVGYAMWALTPPYEHDFDAWQSDTRPGRAPTDRDKTLMEWGHDFFGLMKTARHFIGHALVQQPLVPLMRIDCTPFDFAEFAALAALVAAADRLRDFFIVAVVGSKTDALNQLDEAYKAVRFQGLGEQGDELRALASNLSGTLRAARNDVVHGLATRPAQVQRQLIQMDTRAFETGTRDNSAEPAQSFEELVRRGRAADTEETEAIEKRASLLCGSYTQLVTVGERTFRLEYHWRQKRDAQA